MAELAHLLSGDNRVPLYHQIFLILKGKIVGGEYSSGDYLPGERDLADMYGVSRITAVRALHELAQSGLVVRERGRGTRVQIVAQGSVARGPVDAAEPPTRKVFPPVRSGDPLETEAPEISVLEFEYIAAPPNVAEALGVAPNAIVQRATRVLRFHGAPFVQATSYVPQDIAVSWTKEDMGRSPMFALLERAGIEVGLVEERVTATLADALLAERLDVRPGAPLIHMVRTTYDDADRAVDYFVGFYAPERYQYVVTLPRKALAEQRHRQRRG